MKILWVTVDRTNRVATIFDPLRIEVEKIADVDVVMKQLPMLASAYQHSKYRLKEQPLLKAKIANQYDWVFTDAPFAFQNEPWKKITAKKCCLFEDQHGPNPQYSKRFKAWDFNIFFTRYRNILVRHSHLKDQKTIWLPHHIDPAIYKDYGLPKKIGALMVGRAGKRIYPVRHTVDRQLRGQPFYKKVGRPDETNKPGKKWPVGEDYAKLINSASITFTCLSTFKYPVLKFFEIPGSKSALFSDYNNELKTLGFIPGENMVEISKKIKIVPLVKDWLDKKDKLAEITQKGFDLVHERHTAKKRAEEFLEHLSKK